MITKIKFCEDPQLSCCPEIQSPSLTPIIATEQQVHSSFPPFHISCGFHSPSLLNTPLTTHWLYPTQTQQAPPANPQATSAGHQAGCLKTFPLLPQIQSHCPIPSSAADTSSSLPCLPAPISWGYHRFSPSNLPPPTNCFVADANPSSHSLLTQGLLLPVQEVGWRQTHSFCSWDLIPTPSPVL